MTSPGLTFLSWVRTGAIGQVGAPAGASGNLLDAALPSAATLPVTVTLEGADPASFGAFVVPPGDTVGLDQAQIIRTDPAPGATDVEPNYLAMIEFDRPDLPWMLTPNAPAEATTTDADPRRGLRPWLCLVVVPDQTLDPPTDDRLPPRLAVPAGQLPDLETAWLWAHAQVLTTGDPEETLEELLRDATDRTLSRLICPRRLGPDRRWLACVVPVWEAGVRAGLGLEPLADASLTRAWTHADPAREVVLPVYYAWRFSTGRAGDFESLARRIKGFEYGLAGIRPLDIGQAGAGLPGPAAGADPWLVDYEGAIVGPSVAPGTWPAGLDADAYRQALAVRLDGTPQQLAPPTYGALHAAFSGSLAAGAGPVWLRELNLDPRYRVAAALGTQIVQRHQEALMASAWEQTAELREANRLLRQAQLARALGESIYATRVGPPGAAVLDDERLLQLSAAVHGQLTTQVSRPTVAAAVAPNLPVQAAVRVPFRRVARPRGPLARRLAPAPLPAPLGRLGLPPDAPGKLRPAPPLQPVGGTVDLARLSSGQETMATLGPARVLAPVFPWEPAILPTSLLATAPARPSPPPHAMAYGFLADMLVSTTASALYPWQRASWTAMLARALDADGVPQLGWEQLHDPPATGLGFGGFGHQYAATYVDLGGRTGVIGFGVQSWSSHGWNAYAGKYSWSPGYLLELASTQYPNRGDVPLGTQTQRFGDLAVAAGDLRGTGTVDVVFLMSRYELAPTGSPGMSSMQPITTMAIGRDLDHNGNFAGGWTPAEGLASWGGPLSAAAGGGWLFVLIERSLRIIGFGANAGRTSVDLTPILPSDFRGGALAAADFGGGTGVDLLIFYVAGSGQSLRAAYRIASDIGPGRVGAWSADRPAPIPVGGPEVGILLGAMRGETAQRRAAATAAFRAAAARTQERQQRIVVAAKPPAAASEVEVPRLATDVRTGLQPAATVAASTLARLNLPTLLDPVTVSDPLQPLALAPRFPYQTYELFREAFQDRLFPGASRLPDDRATALVVNQSVVEAFLVGLNHELSRELLWRGFPLHHATYFRSFWDARRHDISTIEQDWGPAGALGSHNPNTPTGGAVLLVVRAELLRRVPHVTVYAVPARPSSNGRRAPDLSRRADPQFSGRLEPDIAFFGFDQLTVVEAAGTGQQDGWYFVFQEHPTAPRFGLDEPPTGGAGPLPNWDELNWAHTTVLPQDPEDETPVFLEVGPNAPLAGRVLPDADLQDALEHRWAFSAAHMAHITLQRPVQVAIHASRLLPQDSP